MKSAEMNEQLKTFREDVAAGMRDFDEGRFSTRTVEEIICAAKEQYKERPST